MEYSPIPFSLPYINEVTEYNTGYLVIQYTSRGVGDFRADYRCCPNLDSEDPTSSS